MSDIQVLPASTRREKKNFLQLPWTIYRGDPYWIPPLRGNQRELVGYKRHPFYEKNRIQTFVAYRGGRPCGRIAAIVNRGHIERHKQRRGFFGFFECSDDQQAADALFDAARGWLAEHDIHCLRGPANPSLNYETGLLVDGFDSSPTFMMTYNPPYYAGLIENYGFKKTQDLYAFWGHAGMLPILQERLRPFSEQVIERFNIKLRLLDKSHFLDDVMSFLRIYNLSLGNTWGFVPMSDAEISHMAAGLRYLMVPELAIGAEIDGKLVGAVFALPDYNPRIKEIDGRLFPFGFLRLLRRKREIKNIRLISTNVLPEYQLMGVGLVLMSALVPKAVDWKLKEAEFSWVLESNSLSRGSLEKGGAILKKTYRLYDWDPPDSP